MLKIVLSHSLIVAENYLQYIYVCSCEYTTKLLRLEFVSDRPWIESNLEETFSPGIGKLYFMQVNLEEPDEPGQTTRKLGVFSFPVLCFASLESKLELTISSTSFSQSSLFH